MEQFVVDVDWKWEFQVGCCFNLTHVNRGVMKQLCLKGLLQYRLHSMLAFLSEIWG